MTLQCIGSRWKALHSIRQSHRNISSSFGIFIYKIHVYQYQISSHIATFWTLCSSCCCCNLFMPTKKLCSLLGLVSVFQRGRTLSEKCIWSQGIGPYTPISRHIVGIVRIGPYTVYIIHLYRHTVPPSFLTVFLVVTALHGVLDELVPIAIPPLWCNMQYTYDTAEPTFPKHFKNIHLTHLV